MARVYLGNISDDARERDVEKFFKGYGKLREVSLKNGYGFVEFEDDRDADDACHDLDGKDMLGGRVRVEMARERRREDRDDRGGGGGRDRGRDDRGGRGRSPRGRSPRRNDRGGGGGGDDRGGRRGNPPGRKTNYRIIVENLSSRTSWQDLKDYFRAAGEITYTNAHKPRQGEGIVEFGDKKGMDYALEKLDDTELNGRRLKLVEEGGGGGGGGGGGDKRGRSRSDSRSKSRSRSRSRNGGGGAAAAGGDDRAADRGRSRSNSRD